MKTVSDVFEIEIVLAPASCVQVAPPVKFVRRVQSAGSVVAGPPYGEAGYSTQNLYPDVLSGIVVLTCMTTPKFWSTTWLSMKTDMTCAKPGSANRIIRFDASFMIAWSAEFCTVS